MGAATHKVIAEVCTEIADFLIEKNKAYGDSALNPIFLAGKKISPIDAIDIRIGDKIKRLTDGHEYDGDDTYKDLLGYLVLRMVAVRREQN